MENLHSDLSDATILSWIMSMIQVLNNFGVMTQTVKQRSEHVSNSMISFIGMYGQFFLGLRCPEVHIMGYHAGPIQRIICMA